MSLIPSTLPFHELSARIESPCGIAIETRDFDGRACHGPSRTARTARRSSSRRAPRRQPSSSAAASSSTVPARGPATTSRPQRRGSSTTRCAHDPEQRDVGLLPQVPRGDAEHEHRPGQRGRRDRVPERPDQRRVGEDLCDRRHLRPMRDRVDPVADWVLHPRVRSEDEVRRRGRADRDDPDASRGGPSAQASQPKIHRPRNVDSRKNAASPSIASGAPKMSPTYSEYADQFIPNWNSWTMPVTTPSAKLIRNSLPKKRVSRSQRSSPVRCQAVWNAATNQTSPIVTGTNRSGRAS